VTTAAPTGTRLRDLSEAEFEERYHCDRFTATVLASRFRYTVQHMATGLLNNAFSLVLRDWYDFATTLSGPPEKNYPMPAVGESLVLFTGTMSDAIRNSVVEYGVDRLKPGDVLFCNDPFRTGTHVNDTCFIRPIFHEDKVVGFANLQAHLLDMGGPVPGGFNATQRNIYEGGIVIGPQLLYENDKPVKQAFNLLFDNIRFGSIILPDIKTIFENLALGERLVLETIDRYGIEAYHGACDYCLDVAAESMRDALERIPDGVYEASDWIDCDGVDDEEDYTVHVRITKRGGRAEVDLSGTSRQARTCVNGTWLDTKTAVGAAFKFLLDPRTPFTSGAYRDIDIVLPEGTFVSAMPPDGAVFLYWESTLTVLNAIFRALEGALGEHAVGGDFGSISGHNANGVLEDGTPWVSIGTTGGEHGPWGATREGDADSYTVFYLANNIDPATEAIESDVPVVLLRKEYAPDTAGAGANRGGAAVLKDSLWLDPSEHYSQPLHFKRASGMGVNGGRDGRAGGVWVFEPEVFDIPNERGMPPSTFDTLRRGTAVAGVLDPETLEPDPNGEYFFFARVPIWRTKPYTMFRYLTNGGGGWGDPLERPPERVLLDVRDEYVTIEGAARDYGVVVKGDPITDPEGLELDAEATVQLREQMRAERGS
jgi:N-methylhydantoinase B